MKKLSLPDGVSRRLHAAAAFAKPPLLSLRSGQYRVDGRGAPWVWISHRHGVPESAGEVCLSKREGRVRRIDADKSWLRGRAGFSTAWRRIGVFVDLVSDRGTPDGDWNADLRDWAFRPGRTLAFCSNHPDNILVPDRAFYFSNAYHADRTHGSAAPRFTERDPVVAWRGSPSGHGALVSDRLHPSDPSLIQRVRMCLMLQEAARTEGLRTDAGIVRSRGMEGSIADRYEAAGILRGPLDERSWCGRRFAIDIDGNANAFSNLFRRLLYGCCVIKVASPLGFRQWYYDRLVPWVHYVPVKADLSDLLDAVRWIHAHPGDAERIAIAGQGLARGMDFAGERRLAIGRIASAAGATPAAADHRAEPGRSPSRGDD